MDKALCDSRGVRRGRCTSPSCSCDGYDGGAALKKCVKCSHPPGKHQNMDTTSDTVSSSVTSTSINSPSSPFPPPPLSLGPSPLSPPSLPSINLGGGSSLHSLAQVPQPTITPVYECLYPGCNEDTPFDANTGEQLSPYCEKHWFEEAAREYQEGQQNLSSSSFPSSIASSTQPLLGNISSFQGSSFSFPAVGVSALSGGNEDSDEDDMDKDNGISMGGPLTSTGAQNDSSGPPPFVSMSPRKSAHEDLLLPRGKSHRPSRPLPPRIDGMMKSTGQKSKLKKSMSSVPLRPQPMQAWLPNNVDPGTVQPNPFAPTASPLGQQQICKLPGCKRPVFVEHNGRVHDFCGRTHASQYQEQPTAAPTFVHPAPMVPPNLQCNTPGCTRQKYANPDGGYFDYCSQYCRNNGASAVLASASTPNLQDPSGYGTCSLPGCTRPKYRDPANGRIHDFCGRTHASQARTQGIQPAGSANVRRANQWECATITQRFTAAWRKGTCPYVSFVFVVSNTILESRWNAYKQQLSIQTVEEYYHGTKLTCNLATPPCNGGTCGICGISSTGLDRRCIRRNIMFQRFGHGFYLAPNSSKCHDYTQGAHGYRAMLLCDVLPGRKYNLTTDNVDLKGPPPGYDSVYGQTGGSLNYAEIVVYNPDAVVPRYIIVYQKDGEQKIAK